MKWILLVTLVFSALFLFIPATEPRDFFPFSEVTISMDTWFYFLFEHVGLLLLAACLFLPKESKVILVTYLVIQLIDTFDYILFYGEPWSNLIPTWNVLKVIMFGSAMVYEKYGR